MRLSRLLFVVLALLSLGWAPPAWAELRLALVIGNSAYRDGLLTTPTTDVRTMAKALRALGFEVIQRENLTKSQMEEAVDGFKERLTSGAVALLYYSGRAVQVNGQNYLVPVDPEIATEITTMGTVPLNTLDVKDIADEIAATQSRIRLVVLDACRDDPIRRRVSGIAAGLAAMKAPPATVIALSAAPGKTAGDGGRYLAELVKALKAPGLSINQVFQQVQGAVSTGTDQAQVPWAVSSVTEAFTLVDAPTAAPTEAPFAVPVRPPAPPLVTGAEAAELALWLSIKDSKDAAAFQGYLTKYPAGRYIVLARNHLRLLQQNTALLVPVPGQPVPTFQPPLAVQQPYNAASPDERKQYDQARTLLRQGEAVKAEKAFRAFVTEHRNSPLAANAQYWLSESLYVRGNFKEAAAAFSDALAAYPTSPRSSESLLKLGRSQQALARPDNVYKAEACKTFAAVTTQFPDAPEAVQAKALRTRLNCLVP